MDNFNSIILEGNLVRNPEARETPKGTLVCQFSIAVNKKYKTQDGERRDEVSFFDIESWGNLASSCMQYCTKGRGVRVVGRLKQSRWQDTEGKNHSKVKIVAEHIDFKPRFSQNANTKQEMADLREAAIAQQAAQDAVPAELVSADTSSAELVLAEQVLADPVLTEMSPAEECVVF